MVPRRDSLSGVPVESIRLSNLMVGNGLGEYVALESSSSTSDEHDTGKEGISSGEEKIPSNTVLPPRGHAGPVIV